MSIEIRLLEDCDRGALFRLLAAEPDSTMFFRSNLLQVGIDYTGQYFSAQYFGAWRGDELCAVVAHCWNGMLLIHEPGGGTDLIPEVSRRAVAISLRSVTGFLGRWAQVIAARETLGLTGRPTAMCSQDILFGLNLGALRVPVLLTGSGDVRFRPAEGRDLARLVEFRVAYHRELLGTPDSPELPDRCRDEVHSRMDGNTFVLVDARSDTPVSCSSFNARVPDTVQIGGVFTPPAMRGRGYGRAVVAGSLLIARAEGVTRSILFTGQDNPAAQTAYRALGYQAVGDYGLILFRD